MSDNSQQAIAAVVADPQRRQALLADPKGTLAAAGVDVDPAVEIRVIETRPGRMALVLPTPPAEGELSDEDLTGVSGGTELPPPEPYTDPPIRTTQRVEPILRTPSRTWSPSK